MKMQKICKVCGSTAINSNGSGKMVCLGCRTIYTKEDYQALAEKEPPDTSWEDLYGNFVSFGL